MCAQYTLKVDPFRIYNTSPITWKSNTITWSTNTHTNHLRPVRWHGDLKIRATSSTQTMWLESLSVWQMRQGWKQIHRLLLFSSPAVGLWTQLLHLFCLCFIIMQPASWTVSSRDIWITLWGRHRPYAPNADKVHEYTQTTERELPRTNYLYGQSSVAVNKSTALPFPDTGEPHTMNRFIGRMLWLYMKKQTPPVSQLQTACLILSSMKRFGLGQST